MLRYEPQEKDEESQFDGRRPEPLVRAALQGAPGARARRGRRRLRDRAAAGRGQGQAAGAAQRRAGEPRRASPSSRSSLGGAAVAVARAGIDLAAVPEDVDRDLKPRSRGVHGRAASRAASRSRPTYAKAAEPRRRPARPGRARERGRRLGAHYDHLGLRRRGLDAAERARHPQRRGRQRLRHGGGAARGGARCEQALASARRATARSSSRSSPARRWAWRAPRASSRTRPFRDRARVAMVNLDMVGRLRDDQLIALGHRVGAGVAARRRAARPTAQRSRSSAAATATAPPTRRASTRPAIPVLHLFTGAHEQYHTPDDKAATLNAAGAARSRPLHGRARRRPGPRRRADSRLRARARAARAMTGDSRGYGAYLGTVPDYRAMEATRGRRAARRRPRRRPRRPRGHQGRRPHRRDGGHADREPLRHDVRAPGPQARARRSTSSWSAGGERVTLRATLGERQRERRPAAAPPHPRRRPTPAATPAADAARRDRSARRTRARRAARSVLRGPPRRGLRHRRRQALRGRSTASAPRRHPPAHLRRRERRGLLQPRRPQRHLPGDAARRRHATRSSSWTSRPASPPRLDRQGPHDLRLLRLAGGRPHRLRVDARRRRRLPAAARTARRATSGRIYDSLRHLGGAARRLATPRRLTDVPGLRRRGDVVPPRRQARLHLDARRRPRPLRDGRGGRRCSA